ncbi:MAG: PTS sugar transporter subunit IIC [Elusimicrobia bacterium]|nr:PTS sugar transporter subunit IIC [Elusimicrobiota bacterium]
MSSWQAWLAPAGGAALVALVELDVVQVGQFMLSRPLVLGPLLGLLFAAPLAGVALGLCLELLSLDDVPVGDSLPLNAPVATAAALLMAAGPRPLPLAAALAAGLVAGWAHQKLESLLRWRRRSLCLAAEERVRAGGAPAWGRLLGRALAEQAAMTFAVLLLCIFVAGPLLAALWFRSPRPLTSGLESGWRLAPWLGLGVAVYALRRRA